MSKYHHTSKLRILIFSSRWPVWKATSLAGMIWLVLGGVEAALIITLKVSHCLLFLPKFEKSLTKKPLYERGIDFPIIILGVIASIFLVLGLLPPYVEIWKRRGRVIGINWVCDQQHLLGLTDRKRYS
jgi:hypothetical protein